MKKPMVIDHILDVIKEHPVLYHPNFRVSRREAEPIWDEVAAKINMTGEELKKKWRNLRDSYAKYLKSSYTDNPSIKNYRNWQHAQDMEYFKPYLPFVKKLEEKRQGPSSNETQVNEITQNDILPIIKIDISDTEFIEETSYEYDNNLIINDNEQDSQNSNDTEEPPMKKSKMKTLEEDLKNIEEEKIEIKETVSNVLENVSDKTRNLDLDATELLFLGYAKLVNSFSLRRQAITKMKIAQLIMEQELEHCEEIQPNKNK